MKNLLKLEFVKLKRRKSFYICTLIMLGLVIISNLTIKAVLSLLPDVIGDITSSGIDSLVSGLSNSSFTLIASIFVILFVCEDYTNQTIKNIYAKGYSRTNVFLSKIISVVISTTIMFLIVEIASFISGTLFFGIGKIESYKFLLLIAAQYLAAMAEIIFAFVIASIIRKNGGAIACVILAPTIIALVTGLVDVTINSETISITNLWLSNFLPDLSTLTIDSKRIATCVIGSLIYIFLFGTIGLYLNNKKDV